jgi:hypothetical protein
MTVREAQRRIDSREFAEWIAFYVLEGQEASGETTPEQLEAKMAAFVRAHRE